MESQDLTRPITTGMAGVPGDPDVIVDKQTSLAADGYRVSRVSCGSHTGTHMDAPRHTEPDGDGIDAIDVDRFIMDAYRVDLRELAPRAAIGPEQLPRPSADVLVIQTGWAQYWGSDRYLEHPFLTPAAAAECADAGYAIAIDALSPDPTPTAQATAAEPDGLPAHHALLAADQLIVENLTNLSGLPKRFRLLALPMNLAGCDGAPVRAIARYDRSRED